MRTDWSPPPQASTGEANGGPRIAGFPVRVNWTAYVFFVLIAYTTATGLLPAAAPGATPAGYWVAGLITAGLLFTSLLAHELAHALVARRHQVNVEGISFWLFGGVAQLRGEAASPRADARIAAVGPASSLALGGIAAGAGAGLFAVGAPTLPVAVAGYLAAANLLLGVFNLLPGAPLDGGRLLRAWLWRRSGDRTRATVTSARAGQVVGGLLITAGVVELLLADSFGGLWTVAIGAFLLMAARAEARSTVTVAALGDLRVGHILPTPTEQAPAVPAWHSVTAVLDGYPTGGHTDTVLAVHDFDGAPHGLVSLAQLTAVPAEHRDQVRAGRVATPIEKTTITVADERLVDLLSRLSAARGPLGVAPTAGHALVVGDHGRPLAVLSPARLAQAVQLATARAAAGQPPTPPGPAGPTDRDERLAA
ncbi:MAG TPA: site-2 protease family protein [Nocardioidaceae bacterium]|nr:site-2 protease family protein [Nocardioidaceae bacterium]